MRVAEFFYSQTDLAVLFRRTPKTILAKIKAGEFGPGVIQDGGDYFVPASGVNLFVEQHRIFAEPTVEPVPARTLGELRRKLQLVG